MTTFDTGEPLIAIYDKKYIQRLELGFNDDGQSRVCLLYPDGKPGIGFALTEPFGTFGVMDSQGADLFRVPSIERMINEVYLPEQEKLRGTKNS